MNPAAALHRQTNPADTSFCQARYRNFKDKRSFRYEGNRNRAADRRSGAGGDPQGDPAHYAHPGGRPVIDDIGTVADILLWPAGSVKTGRMGSYILLRK